MKKERIFARERCNESIDDFTFFLKSAKLVMELRPIVSALRCFQTNSFGLKSGA
jgi:hypothetical protein